MDWYKNGFRVVIRGPIPHLPQVVQQLAELESAGASFGLDGSPGIRKHRNRFCAVLVMMGDPENVVKFCEWSSRRRANVPGSAHAGASGKMNGVHWKRE